MDQETFARHVGEALSHIDDHNWLARCPLRELASSGNGNSGEQLARLLMTTIKQLQPAGSEQTGSPEWRLANYRDDDYARRARIAVAHIAADEAVIAPERPLAHLAERVVARWTQNDAIVSSHGDH
jgi:hypothetical protein